MDERPVEELIGWEPQLSSFYDEELMTRTELHSGWFVDGGAGFTRHRAEVDDMLEWLRLGGFHVQPGDYDFDLVDTPVRLLCVDAVRGSAFIDGDTMRQALEAVVRAVATDG